MRDGALSPLASLELLSSYNPNSALPLPKRAPKAQPFRLPRAIPAISFGDFLIIEPSLIRCLAKFSACNMYRRHTLRFCSIGEINLSEIRIPGAKGHR